MGISPPGASEARVIEQAPEGAVCKDVGERERGHPIDIKPSVQIGAPHEVEPVLSLWNLRRQEMQHLDGKNRPLPFGSPFDPKNPAGRRIERREGLWIERVRVKRTHPLRQFERRCAQQTEIKFQACEPELVPTAQAGPEGIRFRPGTPVVEQDWTIP